jgi:hypothetical protein
VTSRWPSNVTPFSAGTAERSRPDAHKQVPRPAPGRPSSMARFLAKVDFGSSPRGCWLWMASTQRWGHGQFQTGTTMALAHRWFYIQVVGPIPADLDLDQHAAWVQPSRDERAQDPLPSWARVRGRQPVRQARRSTGVSRLYPHSRTGESEGSMSMSSAVHPFLPSANPRHSACERCGLPRKAHADPELHRTSVVGHLNLAIKSVREGDLHMAVIHVGTAQKLLDGDD